MFPQSNCRHTSTCIITRHHHTITMELNSWISSHHCDRFLRPDKQQKMNWIKGKKVQQPRNKISFFFLDKKNWKKSEQESERSTRKYKNASSGSERIRSTREIRPFHFFSRERSSSYPAAGITLIITKRERTICTISDTEGPVVVPRRNKSGGKWFSYCYIHSLFSPKSHRKKQRKKEKKMDSFHFLP